MNKLALIAVAAVATGIIAGVVIAGSGDDSPRGEVTTPELRPPDGSSRTDTDRGTTTEEGTKGESAPDTSSRGAQPPPQTDGGGANAPEDTEQRDVPPPSGSPAERFEQFCADNPGAC